MAASQLQLDLKGTGQSLTTGLSPNLRQAGHAIDASTSTWDCGFEALSHLAGKVCQPSSGEEGFPSAEMQDRFQQQLFSDPTQWWDNNRWSKPTLLHPNLQHKELKVALWLNNGRKSAWVDSQVAMWDAGTMAMTPERTFQWQAAANEGSLEVEMCRKLCEDGQLTAAVNSLNLLVQRGFYIPNDLFYLALKRCTTHKDLVLGRRIHTLSVESGYEGDNFLATHFIGLYASHGMLKEAMRVFSKVSTPNAYTWASLIFAYAKNGEGAHAIRLYREMRESTVEPDNRIYVAVLKACASTGNLVAGKEVHAHILATPGEPDIFVNTGLLDMYAKCGSLEDARSVFDRLPTKNMVTWNAMLTGYVQKGMGQEALNLHSSLQQENLMKPDRVTFVCLLQAVASLGAQALLQGKQLHAQIRERGLQNDVVLGCSLVSMYAKCGSLDDARSAFDRLPQRDVAAWNAMLAGYSQRGMGREALSLYRNMQQESLFQPNSVTFVSLLQACAGIGGGALHEGKKLHAHIKKQGMQDDVVLGCSLVNMYAKCGSLEDARSVFDSLPNRNMVTGNAMLAGYAQQGMGQEALSLYDIMQEEGISQPNRVTFVCLLQACATVGVGALHEGKKLHAQIQERGLQDDVVLGCSLLNMYAKCGSLEDARTVFDRLPNRDVVTWNSMLAGYAQRGMVQDAFGLYGSMQEESLFRPDSATFVCLLQACATAGVVALQEGKQVHAQIEERGLEFDIVVGGSLVNMYTKCGSLEDASILFDRLPNKNMVTWNTMLAGYAQQGIGQEALSLFDRMQGEGLCSPDSVTFICLLQACASIGVGALQEAKKLHTQIHDRGLQDCLGLGSSLVNMYAKCGSLEDARRVFDRIPDRDVVTWNAMLAGYVQQGMVQEAFSLYSSMLDEGLSPPDSLTYVYLLQACGIVAGLPLGKQLHAQIEGRGFQADVVVGAALVNMYARCGSMFRSQQVFDSLRERSIEAWGALIGGYSRHGDSEVVFDLLARMRLEGIQPTDAIFLSVLTVCSHVGLVDKGRKYFEVMETEYGITSTVEHYTCMMDLLGRAGHLDEALQMAKTMPFRPDGAVWHTLLGACWKWNNVEIGQQAFEFAVRLDAKDDGSYVLMANIYARAQMWEEANEMQARRKKCGAWKEAGQSWWTDMDGVVHTFVVGDKTHPESEGIYARLARLVPKLKKEGYVPHLDSTLRDMPDSDKEAELCGHSEKLAIAHALNRTPEGTTIRVVKNLRVCEDCHTATAYISKVEDRTIICRDSSRFHMFREGKCSCGDYW